jgi:predicted patatin/cPLA2 family phospholipase
LLDIRCIYEHYDINLTFKELFEKTNKLLTITTVNISSGKAEYHNYLTEPDLNILLSLRMSTNIPIVFSPIIYKNNYYIDGAFLDPYPFYYHKNVKKIGIWLFEKENIHFFKNNYLIQNNFINSDPLNYFVNLLNILYLKYIKNSKKKIAPKIRRSCPPCRANHCLYTQPKTTSTQANVP